MQHDAQRRVAISFSYNGHHIKSDYGAGTITIDPIDHLKMLIAAIDNANPRGEFDVIVSALGFDPWAMTEAERMLSWQVYRRARLVTSRPQAESHQSGAMWAIRMAMEAAAAIEAEFLIHTAEDVLLHPGTVERLLQELAEVDYVGSHWGDERSLNTQVFGCRVAAFADLKTRHFVVDPMALCGCICEHHMGDRVRAFGRRWKALPDWATKTQQRYFHTHYATEFRNEVQLRGIAWPSSE